ncbi:MAG: hypothetical protein R2692_06750 [Microbacterium sp.]
MAGDAAKDRTEFLAGTPWRCSRRCSPTLEPRRSRGRPRATGISTDDHPLVHYRSQLDARGVLTARPGTYQVGAAVEVAGLVTHRQRPATVSGITFLNLEDEHGLMNVICSKGVWDRYRRVLRDAGAHRARNPNARPRG